MYEQSTQTFLSERFFVVCRILSMMLCVNELISPAPASFHKLRTGGIMFDLFPDMSDMYCDHRTAFKRDCLPDILIQLLR